MGCDEQARFVHTLPLENLHSVLRRFGKTVPSGGGILVSSDWLELAWVSVLGSERAVFQILHGDYDYYCYLALKHEEAVDVFITCGRLNSIVRFIRARRRPELGALLKKTDPRHSV